MRAVVRKFTYLVLLGTLALSACKTTLAPAYDQAIVDKVTQSTDATLRFFASVSSGVEADGFPVRLPIYNELIGNFEALELQARARPVPDNVALDKINEILQTKGSGGVSGDYPSAFAFGKIAETFQKMKETDAETGLRPLVVQAFKGQVLIFLDQALTYESFLKR